MDGNGEKVRRGRGTMKDTGISRNIDDLGRIVIPVELRKRLGIEKQDSLQIFVENDQIILRKSAPNCVACGSDAELMKIGNKEIYFCQECRNEMNALIKK
jgi:AbrB family transcriptional regulator, transcriptional pleiotropic regulator of transition state genes